MVSDKLTSAHIDLKRVIPREEHLRNTRYFAPHSTRIQCGRSFPNMERSLGWTVRRAGRRFLSLVHFEDNSNDAQLVGKIGLILDDKQVRRTLCKSLSL